MKILFVCLGNICRSPMAEGVFRTMARERGIDVETDSCGTGDWHVGEAPDKRARACMTKHDDDISDLRARQFRTSDFEEFDRIFVMDKSNYQNVVSLTANESQREKVELFLNLAYPSEHREVPDPYFGGSDGFEQVYQMLTKSSEVLLNQIDE
ncbi:MAG: low molecular weight protein-tyrosine-phosphatase [Bacteroidota bacterium]